MIKEIGNGKLKILVILDEKQFSDHDKLFEEMGKSLTNLKFTLTSSSNLDNLDHFIFTLNLSCNDNKIRGYGDRHLGILKKSNPGLLNEITETDSPFAKQFAENYEFSTLEIGNLVAGQENIIKNIFIYLNGHV